MILNITEVLGRSEQGVTRPFICRCDDGCIYFVKGLDSNRESQVKEWVVACLARELGLPVAPFALVYADPALTNLPMCEGLGEGYSFGSKKIQVTEITYPNIREVPLDQQLDVLALDWWIKNLDRTLSENGGNPNLFWEPQENQLVVIDHNQAFDTDFCSADFVDYHVFKDKYRQLFEDIVTRADYVLRFEKALLKWDIICAEIPASWYFLDEDMSVKANVNVNEMKQILERVTNQNFWDIGE